MTGAPFSGDCGRSYEHGATTQRHGLLPVPTLRTFSAFFANWTQLFSATPRWHQERQPHSLLTYWPGGFLPPAPTTSASRFPHPLGGRLKAGRLWGPSSALHWNRGMRQATLAGARRRRHRAPRCGRGGHAAMGGAWLPTAGRSSSCEEFTCMGGSRMAAATFFHSSWAASD